MSKDAVLVHHTALEFHGRAYSVFNRFTYQTACANKAFTFHNYQFKAISVPAPLRKVEQANFGIISTEHKGLEVKVASLERTMVDVFNRPVYSGSWEEIWRSLESVEFFDLDLVLEYVKLLDNSTTAACVGFFLEQNKDRLLVDDKYFDALRKLRPKQPHYFDSRQKSGKLLKDWRTISLDDIIFNSVELDRMLLPVLNKKISQKISSLPSFGENLVDQCRKKLSIVFPFSESELKFLNAILDHGEIKPDLITEDPKFKNCISNHPMLKWKALNVRKHFNLD